MSVQMVVSFGSDVLPLTFFSILLVQSTCLFFLFIYHKGLQLGTILGMPVAGVLCGSDLWGGWPSVFYIFGKFLPSSGGDQNLYISHEKMTYLKGITCSLGCPDTSSDCHAVKPNSMVNSRPPAKRKILNYKNNNYSLETIKEHVNIIADKKEGKDSQTTCKKEIKQKLIILQRVRFVKLFRRICSARHICLLWSCGFIIYIS